LGKAIWAGSSHVLRFGRAAVEGCLYLLPGVLLGKMVSVVAEVILGKPADAS
jgi:hypothetical protein